jgi:putative ABC transport system permease protein
MQFLVTDLKYAFRNFRRSPIFVATAIAALTLGIGANTAIFSVVNAVLLKPIPFPDPDSLVVFMHSSPQGDGPGSAPGEFAQWIRETSIVENVAAFRSGILNYTGRGLPEQLRSGQVSVNYFRLFGAPMFAGRSFAVNEDRPGGEHVAVISHGLWVRRFGSDPHTVGRTILLSGEPHVIVGIVGPTFDVAEFGPPPDVWVPFQLDPNSRDVGHYFLTAGRLKEGVTIQQARARLAIVTKEYLREFPGGHDSFMVFGVAPFQEAFVQNARVTMWVLLGAVGCVLLIACANVANLLLVRAGGRRREIAIRLAMGAARGRIVRQLLTESVVLSFVGGMFGLLLGIAGIRFLLAINTAGLPRLGENGSLLVVDWRVLAFTLSIALGTAILFGLMPALHSAGTNLTPNLKEGDGPVTTGFRQNRVRSLLVVAEIALAVVLLVGAALLIRTSLALRNVDPGFDSHNVLTMFMSLSGPRFVKSANVEQLVHEGVQRLRVLAGVEHATATCCVPLQGGYGLPFIIVGRPLQQGPFHGGGGWVTTSPGYFDVFKIPVKRGRTFTDQDDASAPPVVIINEAMAKQYWKGADPLKDQLAIGKGVMREFATEPARQIIGVVGDSRTAGLDRTPGPMMFVPQAQVPDAVNALNVSITPMSWVVRTRVEPRSMSRAIEEQLRQISGLPVSDIRTMDEVVHISTARQRFNMLLMTIFGGSALLLAAIGIYGLMAYAVQQRTHEIGIRLALGADATKLARTVVRQGFGLAAVGAGIGVVLALGLTRFIASLLYGVKDRDPLVLASVPILLVAIGLLAVWIPARRASRVNPLVALRYE